MEATKQHFQVTRSTWKRLNWLGALVVVALAAGIILSAFSRPRANYRKFDATEVARLETDMWKAYYAKNQVNLYLGLADLLRGQYGFSLIKSNLVAYEATRAAFVFKSGHSRAEYEKALPYLVDFYRSIREVSTTEFDVNSAAQLELEWWIIHRQRETYSREDLDLALARLPASVYNVPVDALKEHAHLRAEAMLVRDRDAESGGVSEAEWNRINSLLTQSWKALFVAVNRN